MKIRLLTASAILMAGISLTAVAAWQPGLLGGYAYRTSNSHDMTVEPSNTNVWPCTSAATKTTVVGTVLWANNRCCIYWGQNNMPTGDWPIASFNDDTYYI